MPRKRHTTKTYFHYQALVSKSHHWTVVPLTGDPYAKVWYYFVVNLNHLCTNCQVSGVLPSWRWREVTVMHIQYVLSQWAQLAGIYVSQKNITPMEWQIDSGHKPLTVIFFSDQSETELLSNLKWYSISRGFTSKSWFPNAIRQYHL